MAKLALAKQLLNGLASWFYPILAIALVVERRTQQYLGSLNLLN
ncbi:hypothetical protein QE150_08260 [Acinetobacter baumannii]|nr:hypothetical protein [Acinetobacter baumannii]WGT83271.1 hypothetical protein QE150_08260 [Acinetobacter baumannii]